MKEKVIVKNSVVSVGLLALLLMAVMALPISAQTDTDVLVGRAVLPANTFAAGPTSGQFIGAGPINGVLLPFIEKQPVQGFSAILRKDDGSFYAMSDNGFGKQGNSQDYVFYYRMENSTHAIGDFIAINEHEFLVIERDGSQGDLNGFKKIFKINLSCLDSDSFVEKEEVVNLLDISDPDRISLPADPGDIGLGDPFAFPFVTIEDVVIIDSSTLGVLNDNNYPFSTGRNPNKPDDNEFILVKLDETLNTTAPIADSNTTNQRAAFEFALIGDIPRIGDKALEPDLERFLRLRDEINEDERIRFVMHDGDFKTGSSPCDDINFSRWYGLCNSFKAPFMYVIGDNEWTDCHREKCGGYEPDERLNKLREMFYSVPKSLGSYGLSEMQLTLERQSDNPSDPRYSIFSENFRWVYEDVMFVALNVQGSNNNLGRTPEMDEEFYLRNEACNAFMRESFDRAKENGNLGIMIVIQANPKFEAAPEERTGFNDFLAVLEEETISFEKPVVLVHGDTHYFRIDKPMKSSVSKRRVENFTRVETFGAPDVHWVRATVDVNDPNLFGFKQEIVDENLGDHPQQI